jgi:hypothetical protein
MQLHTFSENLELILVYICSKHDKVAEWLRRQTANLLGSARVSSNLILVEIYFDSQTHPAQHAFDAYLVSRETIF